eukprot:s2059_g6.t1
MWPSSFGGRRGVTPDSPPMVGSPASRALPEHLMGAETPIDDAAGSGALELAEKLQAMQLTGRETEAQDGETGTETASSSWQRPHGTYSQVPSQVSIGTVGHPVSCATPCRYIKRKGGCRDGSACLNCHLCFWVRHQEEQHVARRAQAGNDRNALFRPDGFDVYNVGSLEITDTDARRDEDFIARDRGAPHRMWRALLASVECRWMSSRKQLQEVSSLYTWSLVGSKCGGVPRREPSGREPSCREPTGPSGSSRHAVQEVFGRRKVPGGRDTSGQSPASADEVGSFGHPLTCAEACKYARKPKGCKDGRYCTRCHICHWHRHPPPTQLPSTRWEGPVFEIGGSGMRG